MVSGKGCNKLASLKASLVWKSAQSVTWEILWASNGTTPLLRKSLSCWGCKNSSFSAVYGNIIGPHQTQHTYVISTGRGQYGDDDDDHHHLMIIINNKVMIITLTSKIAYNIEVSNL